MKKISKLLLLVMICLSITACGTSVKNISKKITDAGYKLEYSRYNDNEVMIIKSTSDSDSIQLSAFTYDGEVKSMAYIKKVTGQEDKAGYFYVTDEVDFKTNDDIIKAANKALDEIGISNDDFIKYCESNIKN